MKKAFEPEYFDHDYFFGPKGQFGGNGYEGSKDTAYEMAETLHHLCKPKTSLEIGCALGFMVQRLQELGVDAHGFDHSEYAVANGFVGSLSTGSAEKFPYHEGRKFDLVYSSDLMEHILPEQIDACLAECSKFAGEWIVHWVSTAFEKDIGDGTKLAGMDKTHISMYTPEWWFKKMRQFCPDKWVITEIFGNDFIYVDEEKFNTTIYILSKERFIKL